MKELLEVLAKIAAIDPALLDPVADTVRGMVSALEFMEKKGGANGLFNADGRR